MSLYEKTHCFGVNLTVSFFFIDRQSCNCKVMKRIYISFLIATFSLNLFCQQDSVIVNDSTNSYRWDISTNDWAETGRILYSYDVKGNLTESVYYRWDSETNDWAYDRKWVYYWSRLTTSISKINTDLNCTIYPNPADKLINIHANEFGYYSIVIVSLKGQIIHSCDFTGSSCQLDLSSFQKGVYCITIRSKNFVTTEKIIKL